MMIFPPAPVMVRTLPFKTPGPLVTVKVTGLPDAPPLAYALKSNAGSPKVLRVGGRKVMVWFALVLVTGDMIVPTDRLFMVHVVSVTESHPAPQDIVVRAGRVAVSVIPVVDVKLSIVQAPDVADPFH